MKKMNLFKLIYCLTLLLFFDSAIEAQSVKRQCISSYGAATSANNTAIMQTLGQPYNTVPQFSSVVTLLPGFQQPISLKAGSIVLNDSSDFKIHAFPNPASSFVTIQSSKMLDESIINITDLSGKLIMSRQLTKMISYEIDCSLWENGIYIISIVSDKKKCSTFKLTINK